MKVYVILGSTREYSMGSEWLVAAYTSREQAELHLAELRKVAVKHQAIDDYDERFAFKSPLDPGLSEETLEISYHLIEVPLYQHFDQFLETP